MNPRKMLPTLLFALILSLTLFGCDSGGNTSNASSGSATQPTAVSNAPSANSNLAASPTAGDNNSTANSAANTGSSDGKLNLVKYVPLKLASAAGDTYYEYIGIIRNDSAKTVSQPQMQLIDDSGAVVTDAGANESLLAEVIELPPGQSVGFNMMYMGAPIKNPQFKITVDPTADLSPLFAKMTVLSQQASTSADGHHMVTGMLKNDSAKSSNLWSVNVIAYDQSGNIVDTGKGNGANAGNANDSGIPFSAQSTQKFSVTLSDRAATATRYDIFASGCTC